MADRSRPPRGPSGGPPAQYRAPTSDEEAWGAAAPPSGRTIVAAAPVVANPARRSAAPAPANLVPAGPSAESAGLVRGNALFRRESLEAHLAAARDAEVLRVAPPWSRVVFWMCTSFIALAFVLACVFDVEQTGFARGILRVQGGVQTVNAQAAGTILEVNARSGDIVPAGALLARIDSAQTRAQMVEADRQIALAQQTLDEFDARREKMHAERLRLLKQRADLLGGRVAKQEESVGRLRAKQGTFRKLVKEGLSSELQKSDVDDDVTSAEREALRLREERTSTQLEIANLQASLDQDRSDLVAKVQQAKDKRAALDVQLGQTEVRAPRGGRLEAMLVRVGDSLALGAPVGKLVPTDAPRQVVVFVAERDRAFLAEGAEGRIEVDQLPSGEFGTLRGKVTRIASDLASPNEISDALGDQKLNDPVFRVELTLEPSETLARIEQLLRPGSLVTTRFALRKRRIITVVFEPLRRFFA